MLCYLELLCPSSLELFLWTTLHGVRSGDSSPPSTVVDELAASPRERELLDDLFSTTWRIDRLSRSARFIFDISGLNYKCESDYLVSTDRENYCGVLSLFSEEIYPRERI